MLALLLLITTFLASCNLIVETKKNRNFRFGFLIVLKTGLEPVRALLPTGF